MYSTTVNVGTMNMGERTIWGREDVRKTTGRELTDVGTCGRGRGGGDNGGVGTWGRAEDTQESGHVEWACVGEGQQGRGDVGGGMMGERG